MLYEINAFILVILSTPFIVMLHEGLHIIPALYLNRKVNVKVGLMKGETQIYTDCLKEYLFIGLFPYPFMFGLAMFMIFVPDSVINIYGYVLMISHLINLPMEFIQLNIGDIKQ